MATNIVRVSYRLYVQRGPSMIEYSAEPYASVADARVAARRLCKPRDGFSPEPYVEIRERRQIVKVRLIERVEAE